MVHLVSEVHELLTKIHDILDSALSKWFGITAGILTYLFNSTSRYFHEIWTLQFWLIINLETLLCLVRLAFFGDLNSSVAQTQQQLTL